MKQKLTWILPSLIVLLVLITVIFKYQSSNYDFITTSGHQYNHDDFTDKVLIVNYFAEWCAPCLREIPALNEFVEQAPSNVQVFAISFDKLPLERLIDLEKKYNIKFAVISELHTPFTFERPQYLPATYIKGPNGGSAVALFGEQSIESLNAALQSYNSLVPQD